MSYDNLSYYYLWDTPQYPYQPLAASDLANIANLIKPIVPFNRRGSNVSISPKESLASRLNSGFKSSVPSSHQVTVTDEDSQSHVELSFRSPTPPLTDLEDPFNDSYVANHNSRLNRNNVPHPIHQRRTRSPSPPISSRGSSAGRSKRSTRSVRDSGYAHSVSDSMRGYVVGAPESNIYGNEAKNRIADDQRSQSRLSSRNESPPERPSWGFGPSRAQSRMEEEYIRDYDSEDSNPEDDYRSNSRQSRFDDDDDRSTRGRGLIRGSQDDSAVGRSSRQKAPTSHISSKYRKDLNNYRATKITLFKNGDPWFGSMEYRFMLGKDLNNLDGLFANVNKKMDFNSGISYMFDTEGVRITSIDQVHDGGEYVCSSTRRFLVANYGRTGDAFQVDGGASQRSHSRLKRISYNKKGTGAQTTKPGSGDGRIIKIVRADDYKISERVLLNLKTTQSFEDVVGDLGQVLKVNRANKLYTRRGKEIKSFSHLKMDFQNESTFFVSSGPTRITRYDSDGDGSGSDSRSPSPGSRSLIRTTSEPSLSNGGRRSRSVSRSPARADSSGYDPIKVKIRGDRKYVYPPSSGTVQNTRKPNERMELDWVYGYRGADVNKNLWVLHTGELLYFVGSIAVIYSRIGDSQKHYNEHTEDIQCMEIHPGRELVVSGQHAGNGKDSRAHIRIWNALSLETKVVLGLGEFENGILAVAFSTLNRGEHVMCVDDSKENTLSVWDWQKKDLLGRVSTDERSINGCSFHPLDNNLLITFGRDHLVFWNKRKDSFFERSDVVKSRKTISCIAFLDSGDLVAGDTSGMISTYSVSNEGDYYKSKEFEAHLKGGISCLYMLNEHTILSGGNRDCTIIAWDATRDFDKQTEAKLPDSVGAAVTIISQQPEQASGDNNLFVGTSKSTIMEGSLQKNFGVLVWGHTGELKAVATHPDDLAFVTAGKDMTVASWKKQKVVWKVVVQSECRSVIYHPNGNVVAVGTDDGHLLALDAETGRHIVTVRICGAPLNVVAFSKDGDTLAAGSNNGSLYLYKVSREGQIYKKFGKIAGGVGISNLDWNSGGDFLRSVNIEHDLAYWNMRTNRLERNGPSFRDEDWLEHTCTLSYPVAGAWNNINYKNDDGDITSVHVGSNRGMVVAGDSDGFIRLFRYPCTTPTAEFHEDKAASYGVNMVRFLFDDIYLIACGGKQASLVRWKVK